MSYLIQLAQHNPMGLAFLVGTGLIGCFAAFENASWVIGWHRKLQRIKLSGNKQ